MTKKAKQSPLERFAYNVFYRIPKRSNTVTDAYQTISATERRSIQWVTIFTLTVAAVWGAFCVLLLYIPQYIFPDFFGQSININLPFMSEPFAFTYISTPYGLILVFIEIFALTILNINAVKRIADACGFPAFLDPNYEKHIDALVATGLEQQAKDIKLFGINPYYGVPKYRVYAIVALAKVKATLSNFVFKLLIKRLLGRYALRVVMDLAGMPVYAFWNALASYTVIRETKVRIMGPSLIETLRQHQTKAYTTNEDTGYYVFNAMQYISTAKMGYHHNLSLLAATMFESFPPPKDKKPQLPNEFLAGLQAASHSTQAGVVQLILFGMMIDGDLSRRERRYLSEMRGKGLLSTPVSKIRDWAANLSSGKGLDDFFEQKHI